MSLEPEGAQKVRGGEARLPPLPSRDPRWALPGGMLDSLGLAVETDELDKIREYQLGAFQGDAWGSWEVSWTSGDAPLPTSSQPPPAAPLTAWVLLDVVAGDEGGAAGLWQPHAQSLALPGVGFPHQEHLRGDGAGKFSPVLLLVLNQQVSPREDQGRTHPWWLGPQYVQGGRGIGPQLQPHSSGEQQAFPKAHGASWPLGPPWPASAGVGHIIQRVLGWPVYIWG